MWGIQFFSVTEISTKHSSLYNNKKMIHLLLEYLGNVSMSPLKKENKIHEMTTYSVKGQRMVMYHHAIINHRQPFGINNP